MIRSDGDSDDSSISSLFSTILLLTVGQIDEQEKTLNDKADELSERKDNRQGESHVYPYRRM